MAPPSDSKKKNHYYRIGQDVFGPFSPRQLREEVQEGRLTADSEVKLGASSDWISALTVKGLLEWKQKPRAEKQSVETPTQSPKLGDQTLRAKINSIVGLLLISGFIVAVIVALTMDDRSREEKRIVDGKAVSEWNRLTEFTLDEQSGVAYNLLTRTLQRYALRPDSVSLVGGHNVKPLGCQLSETPKYQSHVCEGRFRFKNGLGIEDETTYTVYMKKYESGRVELGDVEIGGRIVEFTRPLNNGH